MMKEKENRRSGQGTIVLTCPGEVIWMTPAQLHMQVDVLLRAGCLPIKTVGEPGAQGAAVAGMQGMGVNTPRAAAVAEATVGLAKDMHMPKVGMFTMGLESMMVAAGVPAMVLLAGRTLRAAGAAPKEQAIIAPETTSCPMRRSQSCWPRKIEKNPCRINTRQDRELEKNMNKQMGSG